MRCNILFFSPIFRFLQRFSYFSCFCVGSGIVVSMPLNGDENVGMPIKVWAFYLTYLVSGDVIDMN